MAERVHLASAKEAENMNLALDMISEYVVPMALRTVIHLGVPDILVKSSEPLTAEQISVQLNCKSPANAAYHLQRFLKFLTRKGVFSEPSIGRFGLTDLGEMFATDHAFTLVPVTNMLLHNAMIDSSKYLHTGILNDRVPWEAVHGVSVFSPHPEYPEWVLLFNEAMVNHTNVIAGRIAAEYPGFKDVKSVVDVGGGYGGAIGVFVAAHPHIEGINFDLPHVVAAAPPRPGIEHVGGDFLKSVPPADMAFMKESIFMNLRQMRSQFLPCLHLRDLSRRITYSSGVVHNLGDEDCLTLFKNCYEALPKNGKLVISEVFATDEDTAKINQVLKLDFIMMSCLLKGRERTFEEYVALLSKGGFSSPTFVKKVEASDILEVTKM